MNLRGRPNQERTRAPSHDAELNSIHLQVVSKAFENTHKQAWKQDPASVIPETTQLPVVAPEVTAPAVNARFILNEQKPDYRLNKVKTPPANVAAPEIATTATEPVTDSPESRARYDVEKAHGEAQTLDLDAYIRAQL